MYLYHTHTKRAMHLLRCWKETRAPGTRVSAVERRDYRVMREGALTMALTAGPWTQTRVKNQAKQVLARPLLKRSRASFSSRTHAQKTSGTICLMVLLHWISCLLGVHVCAEKHKLIYMYNESLSDAGEGSSAINHRKSIFRNGMQCESSAKSHVPRTAQFISSELRVITRKQFRHAGD